MSRRVSVAEAKNKLPSIIREVEQGSIVEITRYGKAVAIVLPERDYRRMVESRQGFWASLWKVRSLISSEGIAIDESDLRNLRDPLPGRVFAWTE
ncbi:MAG: type II toxin-antitoxin system Phd/YefM family antitoxin [Candidatus Tectomicrobia bacterium]|uniref:Antitoxin n=1 Tax=Tectimicrobiota bacterium TaxID=2528274 RepID=A0A933GJJ1_UNCTE|nr:type II toxin-antitoxin system Phd/YefM family antitoxin [Candidatus Tectomicrobia bacterium]